MDEPQGDPIGRRFEDFVALIARLRAPGGCPWDREQTHESLKPMTLEEAYEVLEAIDTGDDLELRGELGDLLLQVVFHAQIATEGGRFGIADVIGHVSEKMVRRHPHVFADAKAESSSEVLRNWETIKATERKAKGLGEAAGESLLEGVSRRVPAVMEAFQMSTKAGRVGFDWPDVPSVLAKLDEETAELREAIAGDDTRHVAEEIGDLLFSAVNVARKLGVDPESALKAANRKFRERFRYIEERLREEGVALGDAGLERMDALWNESKAR
jgi:MazG family protein